MEHTLSTGHVIEFEIGQMVYLKTDPDQRPRLITQICLKADLSVMYALSHSNDYSWHFGIEISNTIDIITKTNN